MNDENCPTCSLHEDLIKKQAISEGKQMATWVIILIILGSIGSIFYWVDARSQSVEISVKEDIKNISKTVKGDMKLLNSTMMTMEFNLKNFLQTQGHPYIELSQIERRK